MPKRLFLSHTAAASGAELAMLRLIRHLSTDKTAVSFAVNGPLLSEFEAAGIEIFAHPAAKGEMELKRTERSPISLIKSLLSLLVYGWTLGGKLRSADYSVVIAYSVKSLLYGSVAARRAHLPLVWSIHDRIAPDTFGRLNASTLRLLGLILPSAIIVNSYATLSTIWTFGKKVLVLAPGIETHGASETPVESHPLKRVTMVGRLCWWKGQDQFIEAFERVFTGTDVEGLIVGGALFGEQEYEEALRKRAANGPCHRQIRFTGAVDNVNEILRESQIMVHASVIPEPFGAVVLEGLDAGCAVIATRPGGPAEIISDGTNGLLVPCGDVDALEAALRRLRIDNALRDRISRAGVERAAAFDVRHLASRAERWFDEIG